jgi:predicted esterase
MAPRESRARSGGCAGARPRRGVIAEGRHGALRALRALGLLTLLAAAGVARADRDPTPSLAHFYSPLARVERRPAPTLGARVQRWLLIPAHGDTVFALWRPAPLRTKNPWTAVLMGGFGTGDRAALLLPQDSLYNTLAVNWPWRGPRRMSPAEFALELPAIQRAVLSSPSALALGVEAAIHTNGVDPTRVVLVGASLGAFPALAALRLTSAPDAMVLVDAGADLELLIRTALQREGWLAPAAALSAAGACQWIWPMEPTLNAPAAARLPVLLMNSADDELIPSESVAKLHQSLPNAVARWRTGKHIQAHQLDLIARLARDVDAWLRSLPPGNPATPAPRPRAALADPAGH